MTDAVLDAVTASVDKGSTATPTQSHTPTGTPTGAIIYIGWVDTNGRTLDSVTYAGNACTLISSQVTSGGFWKIAAFKIGNPTSGVQTVAWNFSGVLSHGSCAKITTLTGGDTTDPVEAFATAADASTSPSVAVTSVAGSLVLDCMAIQGFPSDAAGAGQTKDIDVAIGGSHNILGSWESASGTSTTMDWTLGTGLAWRTIGVSCKPGGGGGGTTRGTPFGHRGTTFNGGRTFHGIIQ